MEGLIHFNPRLAHQMDHAQAFQKCGFDITTDPYQDAPLHVISGPHYAYNNWLHHPKVLMIDRAWWNDPDCVSIGWLQKDGTRKFATGTAPRPKPTLWDWKPNQWGDMGEIRCIVLADYGQDVTDIVEQAGKRFESVTVRDHPAESTRIVPLVDDMQWADVVIGHSGTALFEAIKYGTPVICTDPNNECMPVCSKMGEDLFRGDREQWLNEMSYKQFSLDEIADGTAWRLLKEFL